MAMIVSVALAVGVDLATRILLNVAGLGGTLRGLNIDAWYGPVAWSPGLFLGFFMNRHFRHRTAYLIWTCGLLWITYGLLTAGSWRHDWSSRMVEARIDLFPLRQGECGTTECLGVLLFTWPFVNSITYSIGAALVFFRNGETDSSQDEERSMLGLR